MDFEFKDLLGAGLSCLMDEFGRFRIILNLAQATIPVNSYLPHSANPHPENQSG